MFVMQKKNYFLKDEFYHVFNKSISNYGIFKDDKEKEKFITTLDYYNKNKRKISLSAYLNKIGDYLPNLNEQEDYSGIKFICYCIMPDHYHLLVKIIKDNFLSKYVSDVENSFSRSFNIKFNRSGPLWQSRFKSVRISSHEQLLHVTRYIHLNPTTSYLVSKPEDWQYSSYMKFISSQKFLKKKVSEISISNPKMYKRFVEDQIDYQRKLKLIKKQMID